MSELSAAKASDTFGRTLMQALAKENPGQNLFVSPLSLFLTLAMTANGGVPATRRGLLTGMSLPDDLRASNAACQELLQALSEPEKGVELELANALWMFAPHQFQPAIRIQIQQAFGAELGQLDLQSAAPKINKWAAEKTHQMVKEVVKPEDFGPLTTFALTNAAYFKGLWTLPFNPRYTRPMSFQRRDGALRMAPMMQATLQVECAFTPTYQAVRLPYGSGRYLLYAFLPATGQTPESLLPELSLFSDSWQQTLESRRIQLVFPKLNLDLPRVELVPTLEKLALLGKKEKNDLTPLEFGNTKEVLYLEKVFHKTRLEIDEAGTRAAAATVAVVTARGGGPPGMFFNRPFVLLLVDDKTQTTLFTGIINDPV